MATGMMIDGEWRTEGYEKDEKGRFKRNPTTFRNWVTADGSSGFKAESGRYHLYVSFACPWAHRTLIMRQLKGLTEAISLSVVDPYMGDNGWQFSDAPGTIPDPIFQAQYLREVYKKADPNYTGRVTVPILWDTQKGTIVNNESREIIRMFDREFNEIANNKIDLCPSDLEAEIEKTIEAIYQPINNGVYRAGFAQSQTAYEEAVTELFEALDYWETVLAKQRYLCGSQLTEADLCMFTTLLRFDVVYYVHFKCNLRHIYEYENLWNYLKDLYQHPGVKETCNLAHIKQHYYQSHPHINPSGIVAKGPIINFDE
ncbi:glutathione S-transferase family protein [Oscillatoria salina]|uniref:glutathione S-transferase family protein n=1 Tax=Oscillatoria salina TaxID=331517 RepID=UPI0013BA7D37|nr:glutathione S-transferase family protein [Oscillatoria salina]MBZ8179031.1 glutathione S-transferase family protein [Oscillatoria salina IIICB1]NET88484.1 glutathione S-transferase family protein [Kamptonema sp. SIO1D9]